VHGCYAQNVKPLGRYYRILERGELPVERGWELSAEDRLRRHVITQIMCNFYVDLKTIGQTFGIDPQRTFAQELSDLQELEQLGLVIRDELVLELTALGRILVRNVAMVFDSYLRTRTDEARSTAQTFSKTI
jgi:oxygen-independent coproporphyrinogen-3 oxidase